MSMTAIRQPLSMTCAGKTWGHVEADKEHRQQERQAEGQDEPGHEGQVERRVRQIGGSLRG